MEKGYKEFQLKSIFYFIALGHLVFTGKPCSGNRQTTALSYEGWDSEKGSGLELCDPKRLDDLEYLGVATPWIKANIWAVPTIDPKNELAGQGVLRTKVKTFSNHCVFTYGSKFADITAWANAALGFIRYKIQTGDFVHALHPNETSQIGTAAQLLIH